METKHVRLVFCLLAGLVGCGSAPGGGGPASLPNGAPAAAAVSPGEVAASAQGDVQLCQSACAMLTQCGVAYGADCASNCLKAPVFVACARTAAPTCNALALCAFQQDSAASCGSATAGVPAGGESCGTTALCEGMCAVANQPASCRCACNAQMAPARAINLLVNNQCALAKCPAVCGPGGNGPACVTCFQTNCSVENTSCVAADSGAHAAPAAPPVAAPVIAPSPPAAIPAPAGTLDPQLTGAWPLTGVQVYWDGSNVPDWDASEAVLSQARGVPLTLAADGTFSLGTDTGNWTVTPFTPADKAVWGTGGRGPDGYARKVVLSQNGLVYTQGPVDDALPPGTAPWGLRVAFRVATPRPGNVIMFFQRHTTTSSSPGTGVKR